MSTADNDRPQWQVDFTRKAEKQALALPQAIYDTLGVLKREIEYEGPVQAEWHHYGVLKGKKGEYHHCHLNKGKPRYVAVWEVIKNTVRLVEIRFVGTHEAVNYKQFK